ncbi:hypothetical protein AMTRI_Chr10g690 [Amborella trichopoda]
MLVVKNILSLFSPNMILIIIKNVFLQYNLSNRKGSAFATFNFVRGYACVHVHMCLNIILMNESTHLVQFCTVFIVSYGKPKKEYSVNSLVIKILVFEIY